jgi:cell wall-associated NlpC family hydrolase
MKTALELQGTRYRLGGDSPESGFDCSGFVRFVFEQQQIELPRTVAEQYAVGKKVSLDDIREGDLLFFSTTAKGPTHVGIALGPDRPGEFVHAPDAGGSVRTEHFDTGYWRPKLVGVRRVL